MKQITLLCFFIPVLFLAQQACNSRKQTSSQAPDSMATTQADSQSAGITTSAEHVANLGLTPDSHWRGVNLGDDLANVKALEKGEAFESDQKHIGYTIEFKNLESADVLYYHQNGKVSAIEADLFLNNRASVDAYQRELNSYFTSRYGTPKPGSGGNVWSGPKGESITLTDVSKGKDFGLKIRIAPGSSSTAASAK
ncbi:hypothetical protein HNV11_16935 [Spirosoma taeanense]|uniref:Uncharacterized protein n=1 Tax=Spirosoma taeanense TaxID=2735870 RepID=A0A6M5YCJ1_9BACT|nr:hypothetical protein [Spirosoma taeanense]QJW90941.1 hypothetical protein HNV11_16935 [Spirosoma taeanense]